MRRSKRSLIEPDLATQIAEALFLYNETIAVYYVWQNLLKRGLQVNKCDALRVVSQPKMRLVRSNAEMAQTILRKLKSNGELEYLKRVTDEGAIILEEAFIKYVIKHGYSFAYAVFHTR